jgi:hypothetical protein
MKRRRDIIAPDRLAPSRSSNSFEYNDPAKFERADDFLVRRPIAAEHHADHWGSNAVLSRPLLLASRSLYLRAKQTNHVILA